MKSGWLAICLILAASCVQANEVATSGSDRSVCSDSWYQLVEEEMRTSDDQMHGPDVGSEEWKSVVEFKLGIRGRPLPSRDSDAWCRHIDRLLKERRASSTRGPDLASEAMAPGPSYDCEQVEPGGIEAMICTDGELSALDRKLSRVYATARAKSANEHPPQLKAEQRGWIKGRDECWKSDDKRGCVRDEYRRRIAELQARYRLVSGNGPVHFVCDGSSVNEVVITFFSTDPPTLIAERGDSVSLMHFQPGSSGATYRGRNEAVLVHADEAVITWGYRAPEMHCQAEP